MFEGLGKLAQKVGKKTPGIGRIIENINEDSPKTKIKNKIRRLGISAAGAATLLSSAAASVGATIALGLLSEVSEDIDDAIDNLSDHDAEILEALINLPGSGIDYI